MIQAALNVLLATQALLLLWVCFRLGQEVAALRREIKQMREARRP